MADETSTIDLRDTGINLNLHAKWREERTLRTTARWLQVRVRNITGRFRVTALQVEAVGGSKGAATDKR